jgi:hypothetical protein
VTQVNVTLNRRYRITGILGVRSKARFKLNVEDWAD